MSATTTTSGGPSGLPYSFRWIEDSDYYSDPIGDDDVIAEELRHFADGSWIALGCIVQHACPECGDEHDTSVSLWGIVVEGWDDPYCREVERELLAEVAS